MSLFETVQLLFVQVCATVPGLLIIDLLLSSRKARATVPSMLIIDLLHSLRKAGYELL